MAYEKIPEQDHILRYAGSNRLQRDDQGRVIALAPQAFGLREGEDNLSVTWMEYFSHCCTPRGHGAVRAFRKSMTKPLGRNSAFGIANVGRLLSETKRQKRRLRVLQEPTPENAGHAIVGGYTNEDSNLLELLASSVFTELLHNKDVP